MNSLDNKDIRISVRDVFFYFLRKWRFIVILIFCFAALLGAYRAVKLLSMIRSSAYQNQAWELYEQAVDFRESETERLDRQIAIQEERLKVKNQYQDESLLMAMDPHDSCVASVDVYVSGDTGPGHALILSSILQSSLKSGKISQELADQLRVTPQYVQELLQIGSNTYSTTAVNEEEKIIVATDSVLLHIGLIAANEDMARELMDEITSSISILSSELKENSQIDMRNNVAFLNYVYTDRRVEELEVYQIGIQDEIKNISNYLEDLQEEKDALEVPVYELMPLKEVFRSSLKYFLAGGFVGGCLSLILLFFTCLYSNKILSAEELEKRTDLKVFTIPAIRKKRFGARIDSFISARELKGELISLKSTERLLELDDDTPRYVIWGTKSKEVLNAIIPDIENKTISDMGEMDSWRSLLPEKDQAKTKEPLKFILFADREMTTYKELNYKLGVISKLKGTDIICVLFV